jgi:hypothetical protein
MSSKNRITCVHGRPTYMTGITCEAGISSPLAFSRVRVSQSVAFYIVCSPILFVFYQFSFDHGIVCLSSIYGF